MYLVSGCNLYFVFCIRGQCDSLKSSASTETTGIESPELSMVLEKAAGERIYILYHFIFKKFILSKSNVTL